MGSAAASRAVDAARGESDAWQRTTGCGLRRRCPPPSSLVPDTALQLAPGVRHRANEAQQIRRDGIDSSPFPEAVGYSGPALEVTAPLPGPAANQTGKVKLPSLPSSTCVVPCCARSASTTRCLHRSVFVYAAFIG
ncbi:hypothetical protein BS78_08G053500 [Paspalum vaginatum]|nr:hypothetical protein BS78_08G053500 [Paspalum vaginatum]